MPVEKQVISIYTGVNGHLDDIPVVDVRRFEAEFLSFLDNAHGNILQGVRDKKELTSELKSKLDELIKEFKQRFTSNKPAPAKA